MRRPLFVLAAALAAAGVLWAQPKPVERPATFQVLLPATAELEISGYKSTSTGGFRSFESPPLEVGKSYNYTLRATYEGQVVTKTVTVTPDRITLIDLRGDFKPVPPKPGFQFSLPRSVSVKAGTSATVDVIVNRMNLADAIEVTVADLPKGVKASSGTIPANMNRVGIAFSADKDAQAGVHEITVNGKSGTVTASAKLRLNVEGAAVVPKREVKLDAIPEVKVKAGESVVFTITGSFTNVPQGLDYVSLDGLPAEVTYKAERQQKADAAGNGTFSAKVTLNASAKATPGTTTVKVTAKPRGLPAGEGNFKLTVAAADKPKPKAELKLNAIPDVKVKAGETATFTVTGSFTGVPKPGATEVLTFDKLPAGVTASTTTTTQTNAQGSGTINVKVTLTAGGKAAAGTTTVKVTAKLGGASAEGSFKLTVSEAVKPKPVEAGPNRIGLDLTTPASVSVQPGKRGSVTVKIDRAGVQGPVRVSIEGLPRGVTAAPATLAAGQDTLSLTLAADADAVPLTCNAVIHASCAGGAIRTETALKVMVEK
jgi:uncharacterized protein (TIGR03000 family)